MKRYIKELILLGIQLFMFYLMPLFAGPTDMMGLVFLIILVTFILSVMLGIVSDKAIKFAYPILVSVLFVPTVWIYYNETALVHAVWYLVISAAGLLSGSLVRLVIHAAGGAGLEEEKRTVGKVLRGVVIAAVVLALFWAVWLFGYHHSKSTSNIPSLTLIGQHDEAYAHKKLQGYQREQLLEVWGEPTEHPHEQEDTWYFNEDTAIKVNYNGHGEVVAVSVFHYIE